MIRDTRAKLIGIVFLSAIAAYVAAPFPGKPILSEFRIHPGIDLAGGAELRYKVLFEPDFKGDKKQATAVATDILRRRIEAKHLKEPKITSFGDDGILIQLVGVDAESLQEYKRLIEIGKLRLHAAAPADLQARFARDKVVPDGYQVVEDTDRSPLLIEENPVIEGRHIVDAAPRQEVGPGGARWVTSFELDAEGAKLFDEAAARLFHQRPRGRIVILLDNKVHSAPVVQAPAFHGRGQISGARE